MNLFRAEEIYIIAQAIEAMVFKCVRTTFGKDKCVLCSFEGRESLRINLSKGTLSLTAMSGHRSKSTASVGSSLLTGLCGGQ